MTSSRDRVRRYRRRYKDVHLYFTPEEWERLGRVMRAQQLDSPAQWVRLMLAKAEGERRSEAGQLVRKNVPLGLVQAAETLFVEKAEYLLVLSRRYHLPGQWPMRQELRQEAGRYMDWAGWCREVIDAYAALGVIREDPTTAESDAPTADGGASR